MLSIRWRKVIRDLGTNKTRTILVLLSIAVGVTAIGMVMGSQVVVDENLPEQYLSVNPAGGTILALTTFDETMIENIQAMDEVGDAEGRRFVNVRFQTEAGEWQSIQLTAIPDFENININKLSSEEGAFPPPEETLLIERNSFSPALGLGNVGIGDTLIVEPPDGKQRELTISGSVHDISQIPAVLQGTGFGYITYDTLEYLGEPRDFNQVVYTAAENQLDQDHVEEVGKAIESRLERAGVLVFFTLVFPPGEHPAQTFLDTFSLILGAMGLLSLFLGGFLIVNTLSAILAQQVKQIGIMKSIGARTNQVTGMYVVLVLLFGILALIISIPLGAFGGRALASVFASFLNFDIDGNPFYPRVILIQTAIALLVPLVAAAIPIWRGVRVTVREAISEQGLGSGQFGTGIIDRTILGLRRVFPMERPQQISLRNTFRRKGRLTLTLITLSLATAIFISIFSIRASLQATLDDALALFDYDVQIIFDDSYRTERIINQVRNISGVDQVETWGFATTRHLRPDGTESDSIIVYAPEHDSKMINPIIIEGRWLEEGDTNAIVVNTDMLRNEENIGVGDTITLDINGRENDWEIVGIARGILTGPNIFINFDHYGQVTKEVDKAALSLIRLDERSPANQLTQGQALEENYRRSGFRVQQMQTIAQTRTIISTIFNAIIGFLLIMAILLGIVGGLGLMGTMSINVIERTREIGVMRAIGASDGAVLRIVLLEGLIIGLISWIIGGAAALPLSRVLTSIVGNTLFQAEPTYTFSVSGAVLWLITVLLLALFASYLPARSASRLTVREVLSYE